MKTAAEYTDENIRDSFNFSDIGRTRQHIAKMLTDFTDKHARKASESYTREKSALLREIERLNNEVASYKDALELLHHNR